MKIGFFGILQLIFITLKLIDKIDWSWWLVFAPCLVWTMLYILVLTVWIPFMQERGITYKD